MTDVRVSDEPIIEVFYLEGNDPFISGINGKLPIHVLPGIEKDIQENGEFERCGTYTISLSWFAGQYGEYGRCEIAPSWGWEVVVFEPLPEKADG